MIRSEATSSALIDVLGPEGYARLCAAFRGKRLHVPKSIGPHHPIAHAVGPDAAARLAERFGDTQLHELPMPVSEKDPVRQAILRAKAAHPTWSVPQIRAHVGCSRRRVQQVLNEAKDDPPQGCLF